MSDATITLSRDVTATRIPQGEAWSLSKGTHVLITQELGGSFTVVIPTQPGLYRIENEFADALGKEKVEAASAAQGPLTEEAVWETLKTCFDPEIPVNIVDLGLVYDLDLDAKPEGASIKVAMTLTAPGCGMGPVIAREAQQKIAKLPGVSSADVNLVWDPPWSPERISEDGKKKLGMV
ncbi:MAG: putative Fe-S cluster assembly protein SufT [Verrucomicrobium sp.]|nr:putative Fe-S cluster assembly protein SufT [Verrucomicrobium sp.]